MRDQHPHQPPVINVLGLDELEPGKQYAQVWIHEGKTFSHVIRRTEKDGEVILEAFDGGAEQWQPFEFTPALLHSVVIEAKEPMPTPTVDMTYPVLARQLRDRKLEIDGLTAHIKQLKADLKYLQEEVLPAKLERDEMQNVTVAGVGRLSNNPQFQATPIAAHKAALQKWLEENGWGALVQETINSSTFKSWVKERMEEGDDIPMDYINVHSFDKTTLTKA